MPIVQADVAHVCLRTWVPGAGAYLAFVTDRAALAVMRVVAVVDHMG